MFLVKVFLLLTIASVAWSLPTDERNEDLAEVPKEQEDVGKPVAKRTGFLREYGDEDSKSNDRGYHRTSEDQGDDGYKHYDSFHKKNSDKYGHEHHSAFGKSKKSKKRGGASNAKYDDKEPHEASASSRVFRFASPWSSSGTSLPHIIGFDIEALASKFDRHSHNKHRIYDTIDHDHHHHHEFYHDHHPHHLDDVEYDHPPPSDHHKHVEEFDHPPIHYDSHNHFSHKPSSHDDVPKELDHPPPGYEHEDGHQEKPPADHEGVKELEHPPPGYEHEEKYHLSQKPPSHGDVTKELDHPPLGYDHEGEHQEKPPLDHDGVKELDHPPPGYEHEKEHIEKLPAHHTDAKELDHPPPDYEHDDGHHGDSPPDHAGLKELDHPPPGYDHEHFNIKALHHPLSGYEFDNEYHGKTPTDHVEAKELDHPPLGYENGNKHDEKPASDSSDSKERDHPPLDYDNEKGNFNVKELDNPLPEVHNQDAPLPIDEADDQKFKNVQSHVLALDDKIQGQSSPPSTEYPSNFISGNGKLGMVLSNSTQFTVSKQESPDNENFPIVQNGINAPEFVDIQTPPSVMVDTSSSSTASTQVFDSPLLRLMNKGRPSEENTTIDAPSNQFGNSSSNLDYLPPPMGANDNYKIFFGAWTGYDHPKPYYDVNHWEKTLENLKSNAPSSEKALEVSTASNATEQRDMTGEEIKGTQSGDGDKDMLRDSYGNRYIPIDLKRYLPPLSHGGKSSASVEANSAGIGGNDGIFYGESHIPEQYFGGKFEQDVTGGGLEKSADGLNDGEISGEIGTTESMAFNSDKSRSEISGDTTGDKVKFTNAAPMKAMKDFSVKTFNSIEHNYYLPPYEINNILLTPPKSAMKSMAELDGLNNVFGISGSEDGDSAVASPAEDKKSHNHDERS